MNKRIDLGLSWVVQLEKMLENGYYVHRMKVAASFYEFSQST